MSVAVEAGLATSQALHLLLTMEGFLLAVISLSVSLGAPGRVRQARTLIPPAGIAWTAAVLALLTSVGALAAWWGLYARGGDWLPLPQIVIGFVLLAAIVAQPVIAFSLAAGLRPGDV